MEESLLFEEAGASNEDLMRTSCALRHWAEVVETRAWTAWRHFVLDRRAKKFFRREMRLKHASTKLRNCIFLWRNAVQARKLERRKYAIAFHHSSNQLAKKVPLCLTLLTVWQVFLAWKTVAVQAQSEKNAVLSQRADEFRRTSSLKLALSGWIAFAGRHAYKAYCTRLADAFRHRVLLNGVLFLWKREAGVMTDPLQSQKVAEFKTSIDRKVTALLFSSWRAISVNISRRRALVATSVARGNTLLAARTFRSWKTFLSKRRYKHGCWETAVQYSNGVHQFRLFRRWKQFVLDRLEKHKRDAIADAHFAGKCRRRYFGFWKQFLKWKAHRDTLKALFARRSALLLKTRSFLKWRESILHKKKLTERLYRLLRKSHHREKQCCFSTWRSFATAATQSRRAEKFHRRIVLTRFVRSWAVHIRELAHKRKLAEIAVGHRVVVKKRAMRLCLLRLRDHSRDSIRLLHCFEAARYRHWLCMARSVLAPWRAFVANSKMVVAVFLGALTMVAEIFQEEAGRGVFPENAALPDLPLVETVPPETPYVMASQFPLTAFSVIKHAAEEKARAFRGVIHARLAQKCMLCWQIVAREQKSCKSESWFRTTRSEPKQAEWRNSAPEPTFLTRADRPMPRQRVVDISAVLLELQNEANPFPRVAPAVDSPPVVESPPVSPETSPRTPPPDISKADVAVGTAEVEPPPPKILTAECGTQTDVPVVPSPDTKSNASVQTLSDQEPFTVGRVRSGTQTSLAYSVSSEEHQEEEEECAPALSETDSGSTVEKVESPESSPSGNCTGEWEMVMKDDVLPPASTGEEEVKRIAVGLSSPSHKKPLVSAPPPAMPETGKESASIGNVNCGGSEVSVEHQIEDLQRKLRECIALKKASAVVSAFAVEQAVSSSHRPPAVQQHPQSVYAPPPPMLMPYPYQNPLLMQVPQGCMQPPAPPVMWQTPPVLPQQQPPAVAPPPRSPACSDVSTVISSHHKLHAEEQLLIGKAIRSITSRLHSLRNGKCDS